MTTKVPVRDEIAIMLLPSIVVRMHQIERASLIVSRAYAIADAMLAESAMHKDADPKPGPKDVVDASPWPEWVHRGRIILNSSCDRYKILSADQANGIVTLQHITTQYEVRRPIDAIRSEYRPELPTVEYEPTQAGKREE